MLISLINQVGARIVEQLKLTRLVCISTPKLKLVILLLILFCSSFSHSTVIRYPYPATVYDYTFRIDGYAGGYDCWLRTPPNARTVRSDVAVTDPKEPGAVYTVCYVRYLVRPEANINLGQGANNTCYPINIATGNKFFTIREFVGHGLSPLKLQHAYNSLSFDLIATYYRQSLVISNDTIQAKRNDGSSLNFDIIGGYIDQPIHRQETLTQKNGSYVLTLLDNTREYYNSLGQLTSILYPTGVRHKLDYQEDDRITVSRLGQTLELNLEGDKIANAILPDGSKITHKYDNANGVGRLLEFAYEDGNTRTYLYENATFPHYITGIIDENGNRISSVAYDDQGRAISSEVGGLGSGIERTEIEYHDDGRRTVTNALGKKNTYHFTQFNGEYKMTRVEGQPSANCAAANQAYTYDDNGFMASKTDWKGNVTTYTHNDRGLETSRTEASGTPQARTITTQWHDTFNLRTQIIHPDTITSFTYDSSGRLLSKEVSPR